VEVGTALVVGSSVVVDLVDVGDGVVDGGAVLMGASTMELAIGVGLGVLGSAAMTRTKFAPTSQSSPHELKSPFHHAAKYTRAGLHW